MTKIELVTRPSAVLAKPTTANDDDVALAAWVSFAADEPERLEDRFGVERLIGFLMSNQHDSPFEHSHFTFKVDCPLFVAREFHRHRTQSYNEVSGRYTELQPRFYVPRKERPMVQVGKPGAYHFVEDPNIQYYAERAIEKASRQSWEAYQDILMAGAAKEVARMVLPVNIMTQFYATVNARNLMHFIGLRTSPHALDEIRTVAGDMEKILAEHMPLTYKAWEAKNRLWAEFREWKKTNV